MRIVFVMLGGFLLDLLLGDPEKLAPLHPVVWMGRAIRGLEKTLRARFPKTERGAYHAGLCMAALMITGTAALSAAVLYLLNTLWPPLSLAVETLWCWQALAAKDLRVETMRVYDRLRAGTLEEARGMLSRIVGRDTGSLDAPGVIRAAVETVAENFSDGVTAPMLYMALGGAPLALGYKAVNTMDSMVGYRSERYRDFGKAPARIDDAVNFLPARLSALLLIAAAALCGEDARQAARIWRRDRRRHDSPNAGQCEAAMAGALGVRLCGPASYFGERHDKPYIGDDTRPVGAEDIPRACRMEAAGSLLCLGLLCLIRLWWVMI